MDPVYGPPLEADGSVTQVPLMETVEVPLWDDVAETIPTMVQATQTVTRQVEINGVLQTEDAPDVIIRYDPREITEERPNNWHYFEDNVDFGSNFTIYEGYNAPDLINGGVVTGDPNTAVSVPTPTEAEMINPGYEDYVVTATRQDGTETTTTRSASIDILRHHDLDSESVQRDEWNHGFCYSVLFFHTPASL